MAGIRSVVLLPRNMISTAQLVQPLANGALVLALDADFDGCMAIVQQLAREPGIYLANSLNSLRLEGQKTIAIEIVQQFDWEVPDWIVIPGGNLGNVSALGAGLLMLRELGLISHACRASPSRRPSAPTRSIWPISAASTSSSRSTRGGRWRRRSRSAIRSATSAPCARCARSTAWSSRRARASWPRPPRAPTCTGMFNDPHTGVALAVLEKLVARGTIDRGQRAVVISTANGLKFTDFKVRYHERRLGELGITSRYANQPLELPGRARRRQARVFEMLTSRQPRTPWPTLTALSAPACARRLRRRAR